METSLPLQQKERLFILDAIRGIALCGILILNIYFFGRPEQGLFNLNVYSETTEELNIAWWYLTNFLVEGSYRALFSMLFGAGALLLISRLEQKNGIGAADVYYRRLIWLLIFGLINAYVFLWVGDILYPYALCGLFIFPFRNSSPRLLIWLAIFFVAVTMFKTWNRQHGRLEMREKGVAAKVLKEKKDSLSTQQKEDLEAWNGFIEKRKVESMKKEADKEIKEMNSPSYVSIWKFLQPINHDIETNIMYDVLFFDVIIFILLGMAFYKMGILTGNKPIGLYVAFFVGGYSLGLGWGFVTGRDWINADFDVFKFLDNRTFSFDFYQIHRLLVACGHLGLIILLWKSNLFDWFLKLFSNVGQLAFSNYLMQSIICTFFFFGYGLNYFGKLQRYELAYVVLAVWIFQIIFSAIWLKYFLFGPLEWIWRSLTYWKKQPILRSEKSTASVVA